jgi:hypothetical protein
MSEPFNKLNINIIKRPIDSIIKIKLDDQQCGVVMKDYNKNVLFFVVNLDED